MFSSTKKILYKPQNHHNITGTVRNILGKPVANTPVWIHSKTPALDGKEMTDENGVFTFRNLLQIDTASYFFQALKPNLKPLDFSELDIDRVRMINHFPFFNYPIMPWYVNADSSMINLIKRRAAMAEAAKPKGKGTILKEVKIREKKVIKGSYNEFGPGIADYIFDENDIKRSGLKTLYDFLFQKIPGLRMSGASRLDETPLVAFRYNGMTVVPKLDLDEMVINDFDGHTKRGKRQVDRVEELSKFDLADIRGIELTVSDKYTHWKGPKMAITSYSGIGGLTKYQDATYQFYRPIPTTLPRQFYSPKYQIKSPISSPDYRTTLHWEPNIVTDKNGKATVTFYTSDSDGNLSFNLQGLSNDGRIGSLLYRLPNKK